MRELRSRGLRLALPAGWEGRIKLGATDHDDEEPQPVVHAATFALPSDTGDYGGGAVEAMGSGDIFVAVIEFGPESLGTPLFARQGLPRLTTSGFDPLVLQRVIPGQSGYQAFFTAERRPFCLYVVLGSHQRRLGLVPIARSVVDEIQIG